MDNNRMRLLIVGGVAGGASCAARARRLSEDWEIIIFERGPYVSFANCGLPYYIGKVIVNEDDLLVASPELFRDRFDIEVRTESNVKMICRDTKDIEVEDIHTGKVYREKYDALLLSPGSETLRPGIEGIDLPGIFTVGTIPDTRAIVDWIKSSRVSSVAVVGGGFIGLEMAENLKKRGIGVTIIEMQHYVMPAIDPEIAAFIHDHLQSQGVELCLGSAVKAFRNTEDDRLAILLENGKSVPADMVILAMGVRPRVGLARESGLSLGELGGIQVNEQMQSSDPDIWAVGDAVEVYNVVSGKKDIIPLAGPANRQGRIAAESILGLNPDKCGFRGVQGTAVCGILGLTVASTGTTEKRIKQIGYDELSDSYEKIYLHPDHHAAYYPDAQTITIKLIFSKTDGRILGAQAVGMEGVEKRIDVISMAIQRGGTVFDLEETELCYAPQYGSAKDPVNLAGMIATNVMKGYLKVSHWDDLDGSNVFLLDVRDKDEFEEGHVPHAVNIPLNSLRANLDKLPRNQEIRAYCYVGQRSYFAARLLSQKGYRVSNMSGGYLMYEAFKDILN